MTEDEAKTKWCPETFNNPEGPSEYVTSDCAVWE